MNKLTVLLPLALILLSAGNAKAQTLISQSEAFDRVATMFENRDVDYYTSNNKYISSQRNLNVTPDMRGEQYTVVVTTPDGELSREEVTVGENIGIRQISPAGSVGDYLDVELFEDNSYACTISIMSILDGREVYSRTVMQGENNFRIDMSDVTQGLYMITCTVRDNIVNTIKFSKK